MATPKQVRRAQVYKELHSWYQSVIDDESWTGYSIDVEAWDVDATRIKQIGMVIFSRRDVITSICWSVKETASFQNRYCSEPAGLFKFGATRNIHEALIGS